MENSSYLAILVAAFFLFYPVLRKFMESLTKKVDPANKEEVRREKLEKFKSFLGSIDENKPQKAKPKPLLSNRKRLRSSIEDEKELSTVKQRKLTSNIESQSLSLRSQEAVSAEWGEVESVALPKESRVVSILHKLSSKQEMVVYHEILKGPKSRVSRW